MAYLIKIIVATLVIVLVTELSKKDTKLAALLLALPIISFTAYTMIWFESKDADRIAKLANENFIYVLPVMPVLPLFSWLLKHGFGYFTSMIMVIIIMIILFYLLQKVL
jgi:ABC-type multidrug transport system permease subunit